MDIDIVTSIIAQKEEGYITQLSNETENTEAKRKRSTDFNTSVNGEAKIWKLTRTEGLS